MITADSSITHRPVDYYGHSSLSGSLATVDNTGTAESATGPPSAMLATHARITVNGKWTYRRNQDIRCRGALIGMLYVIMRLGVLKGRGLRREGVKPQIHTR